MGIWLEVKSADLEQKMVYAAGTWSMKNSLIVEVKAGDDRPSNKLAVLLPGLYAPGLPELHDRILNAIENRRTVLANVVPILHHHPPHLAPLLPDGADTELHCQALRFGTNKTSR